MLVLRSECVVVVASVICLASAYSTRFIMEGENEGIKTMETETKTPKMEEKKPSDAASQESIAVKVIPFMTNVFTQTEDLFNMTPLKLVTAIAAQHLLTSVQNIPVAGKSPQDTLDMLTGIVKELNKTAQIIKLTAEYVNVSGHYILKTLDEYAKADCQEGEVEKQMKNLKENFLKSITDHVLSSVEELNGKTKESELSGSDILISSSYHIVAAFQEMTNQAVAVASEGKDKCSKPPPKIKITAPSSEVMNGTEVKGRFTVHVVPEQGKKHKSIKKDQATPKKQKELTSPFENFLDQMTIENFNNQDKTVEVFSPETIIQTGKKHSLEELNVPEGLKIEYVPFKTISLFETPKKDEGNKKSSIRQEQGRNELDKIEIKNTDKELASSNVDSLSNVPWPSPDSFEKIAVNANTKKSNPSVGNFFDLLSSGYNKPLVSKPKSEDDELVEPVCGVDKSSKKFIIFLNDQKRVVHNKAYGTNYVLSDMETCVEFLIHSPSLYSVPAHSNIVNNVDLRPR